MNISQKKNIVWLALGQGLTGSIISLLTLSSTLVGVQLAPIPELATLPVTGTVVGAALMIYSVSTLMEKFGRRIAFIIGSTLGLLGCLIAGSALLWHSFAFFTVGTFVLGAFSAFNQYYRFAAAEVCEDGENKKRATAWVVGGGIMGGFLGPFVASQGVELFPEYPFFGSFVFAALICLFTAIVQAQLTLGDTVAKSSVGKDMRPLSALLKDRAFLMGTASCAIAFSVMTLLMNSAPLAMHHHHFSIANSAVVLQWHFVAMYAPALLLVGLATRLRSEMIIVLGVAMNLIGILLAYSGTSFFHFLSSLIMFGIGWAFMFNGGTFLLNAFSHSIHKSRVQGINSLITYVLNAIASLSVGGMMALGNGWDFVNTIGLVGVIALLAILLTNKWKKG
ncbi:MFS transporter [Photorhabdus tasmaniensis]|uniref:MFS transporter n=1 Tax=Photorhabdus tasmaniensis TaxID=1004159 RepID=UPI00404181CA